MNTVDCTPLLPALPSDITVNRKGISHQSLLIQYINVQIYKYSGIEAVVELVFVVTFDNKAVLNGLLAVNEIVLGDDADGEAIDLTDALVLTVCVGFQPITQSLMRILLFQIKTVDLQ